MSGMADPIAGCAPFVRLVHDFQAGQIFHLPARRINDHALLYIHRGEGTLQTDGRDQAVGPGTVLVVPPDREHAFSLKELSGVNLLNVHYDPAQRADSTAVHWHQDARRPRPPGAPGPLPADQVHVLTVHPPAAYVAAFRRLARTWPAAAGSDLLVQRASMLELLAVVLRRFGSGGSLPAPDPHLERARRHLDDANGPVRLEDVAAVAHLGRSAFAAAFTRHYGLAPMAYRRRSRIERAKADLQWGGMTVKAAARRAGFANVQHFTRVFSRLVGEPPAAFAARTRSAE
ncbi:hypothetical protein LBMAG53_09280 [Planctomycetota bacterium]|nr:hypothetical protein LBMAG53_09280 [Planctomycetota bacterium]